MENDLKIAKEKAISFLFNCVNPVIESVEKKELPNLEPLVYDEFPLRMEAFAYLANRDKDIIQKYKKTITKLWQYWKDWISKGKGDPPEIFWPAEEGFLTNESNPNDKTQRFALESHTAMFRAREVLGIEGFNIHFDLARGKLRDFLTKNYKDFY